MANTVSRLTANGNYFIAGQFDEVTYNTNALNINKQFNGPMVNLCRSSNDMTLLGTTSASITTPWYYGSTAPMFVNRAPTTLDPFGGYNAFKVGGQSNPVSNYYALNMDPRSFFNSGNGSGNNNLYLKAGATYCYSIYAKAAEYGYVRLGPYDALPAGEGSGGSWEIQFNIVAGTFASPYSYETAGMINVGNGWWRCYITRTIQDTTSTGNPGGFDIIPNPANSGSYVPDGKSGCYLYGMQVELGTYPSKYIPTDLNGPLNSGASKFDASGNMFVIGTYDEYTRGMNLIQNGLVYYMDPSKPECWNGNTALYDLTGTNPPGVLVGGYRYSPEAGGVITLDGLTGYANTNILGTNPIFQSTQSFTMSIWCKFTSPSKSGSGGTSTLFGCFNFQGFGIIWQGGVNINVNTIYAGLRINTGAEDLTYTSDTRNFQTNKWYNYVFSYSGPSNFNYLYVNGSTSGNSGQQTSTNLPYSSAIQGLGITIGNILQESGGQAGYFPGQIGQALIYNRALSAAEINQNFQEMRSQYGV
jgi:hypothetical protein